MDRKSNTHMDYSNKRTVSSIVNEISHIVQHPKYISLYTSRMLFSCMQSKAVAREGCSPSHNPATVFSGIYVI